jgi:hypothetical protein
VHFARTQGTLHAAMQSNHCKNIGDGLTIFWQLDVIVGI